jgi:hypothetical protein
MPQELSVGKPVDVGILKVTAVDRAARELSGVLAGMAVSSRLDGLFVLPLLASSASIRGRFVSSR